VFHRYHSETSMMRFLKALEAENAKLERLVADGLLDNVVLKAPGWKALTSSLCAPLVRAQWRGMQRRHAVLRALRDHPMSQRRFCVLTGVDSKIVRRKHPLDNPEIRLEMKKDRKEAAPVWVSAHWRSAGSRGHDYERKETLSDLPARAPVCAPPSWPQTGDRQPHADASAAAAEPKDSHYD
jgi:hypothetical protein